MFSLWQCDQAHNFFLSRIMRILKAVVNLIVIVSIILIFLFDRHSRNGQNWPWEFLLRQWTRQFWNKSSPGLKTLAQGNYHTHSGYYQHCLWRGRLSFIESRPLELRKTSQASTLRSRFPSALLLFIRASLAKLQACSCGEKAVNAKGYLIHWRGDKVTDDEGLGASSKPLRNPVLFVIKTSASSFVNFGCFITSRHLHKC